MIKSTAGFLLPLAPVIESVNLLGTADPTLSGYASNEGGITLGTKIKPLVNGNVMGIRYHRHTSDTEVGKVGKLYKMVPETLLAFKTFSESGSGWQTVLFDEPVPITSGTLLIACFESSIGNYSYTWDYFLTAKPNTEGNLEGVVSTESLNGVFSGPGQLPTSSHRASCYWVDLLFQPT